MTEVSERCQENLHNFWGPGLIENCKYCGYPLFESLLEYARQCDKDDGYFEIPGREAGFLVREIEKLREKK